MCRRGTRFVTKADSEDSICVLVPRCASVHTDESRSLRRRPVKHAVVREGREILTCRGK